jgi:hypothetical protein
MNSMQKCHFGAKTFIMVKKITENWEKILYGLFYKTGAYI